VSQATTVFWFAAIAFLLHSSQRSSFFVVFIVLIFITMIANIHHGVSKVIRFGGQTLDKFGRVFEQNAYIEKCMQKTSLCVSL
jgi:hypothetical protein